MGYFDGLSSASFKKDESGRTIFYLWGVFGKGYVLPDEETESRIKGFIRRYYMIALAVVIILAALAGWVYALAAVPVLMVWYLIRSKVLVAGCSPSQSKLTVKESYGNSAKTLSKKTLWLLLILSIVLACGGLLEFAIGASTGDKLMGGVTVLFFGGCAVIDAYMIKRRGR